ncbi:MAG: protein BatD [Bacteroidaceae bacterium]|nr:protein BatD [Bacteroidaceae bacterium]
MKRYLTFLIVSIVSLFAFAEDVTLNVYAPSTVEAGNRFRVQFTVNTQNVSNFQAPDFSGFEVIYGPSTSSQSSYQIINGHTSQSSSITYSYVILANRAGTYKISSASVHADGKTVKSNPVSIKVLPSGQGGSQRSSQSSSSAGSVNDRQQVSRSNSGTIGADQLFMTATASRTKVYEQEAILLTYKLYTLVQVQDLDGKLPSLDGFQVQQMPQSSNLQMELESYNGRNYYSVVWCQYVLFPQKSGNLVIPSVTFDATVLQQKKIVTFDDFFNGGGGYTELKKKISTPKLTIHVSPLPAKPDNFSGAVGEFSISSSCSPQEAVANDAVTVRLSVKGVGNMKLINAPKVDFPKDFEVYDPKVNDKFSLTKSGLSGTKEFEYLVVPRHGGQYKIPSISFVYFDPSSKTYKTLKSEEYTINVKKGSGSSSRTVNDYSSQQQDVKELDQDIRYIKIGDVEYDKYGESFFGTTGYILCYVVPFLLFLVALFLGRRELKENANIAKSRGKKANKMAIKRLKNASKLLKAQNQNEFYDEVMRALWGYIADKLNMPQENLNKDNVLSELTSRNVAPEASELFIKALNDCEFARYAPGDAASNMQAVYESAEVAISKIEDYL